MTLLKNLVGVAHAQNVTGNTGSGFSLSTFSNLFSGSSSATALTTSTIITFGTNLLLTIAAIAAFVYLVLSGFNYITAGGDAEKATKARTGILNAIIGIVIIFLAWAIVQYAVKSIAPSVTTGTLQ